MPGSDKRTITVQCSRCSAEYVANRQHFRKTQQLGRPNYCPACCRQIHQAAGAKSGEMKQRNRDERIREFMAPCRLKIVPKSPGPRSRCKPALAGGCPLDMLEQCLDFTARNDWPGWRVAE